MREKFLTLINLLMVPFETVAENLASQFHTQFKRGFGEDPPPEALEAVATVTTAFKAKRTSIEDKVIALFERHFAEANLTETDLDALLVFYDSPLYKKFNALSPALQQETNEAVDAWVHEAMDSVEHELQRLLGAPAAAEPTVVVEDAPAPESPPAA